MENKYVGVGGRLDIYFGAPVFIIVVLGKLLFEKLLHVAGLKIGIWIVFGIALAIITVSLLIHDRIPAKLRIPIGIIGWLLTISIIFWFVASHA